MNIPIHRLFSSPALRNVVAGGMFLLTLTAAPLLAQQGPLPPEDERQTIRVLFVGAGGEGLGDLVKKLTEALNPRWKVETGSAELEDYRAQLRQRAAQKRAILPTEPMPAEAEDEEWDVIVFQEQRQEKAEYATSPADRRKLLESAPVISSLARETDAIVVYCMTWGFPNEEPTSLKWYPQYGALQKTLASAYREMEQRAVPAYVAPVGLALQSVYQDMWMKQKNPLSRGSKFRELYGRDSEHPSQSGAYLAACIVVATFTGKRVRDADWAPEGLDSGTAAYLRGIADRVAPAARPGSAPWQR